MAKKWDKDGEKQIDFNYLKSILNNSKVQVENNALYQVIFQLIKNAQQNKDITVDQISNLITQLAELSNIINNISTGLANQDYLTSKNDFPTLPNSRQLLPGSGILFDDTTNPHQRIVSSTGGGGGGSGAGFGIDLLSESGSDEVMMMPPGTQGNPGPTGSQGSIGPAVYLDFETIEPDPPIPGLKGADGTSGTQGATGPAGPIGLGLDGDTGDDGFPIPGTPGQSGNPGLTGPQGPIGLGLDGDAGEDGLTVPGQAGINGITGAQGPMGPAVFLEQETLESDPPIPGTRGIDGVSGATGAQGPIGIGLDGDQGDDGLPIPGPTGIQGNQGATGPSGGGPPGLDGSDADDFYPLPGIAGSAGATGTAGINGTQPDELVTLIGRYMKRVWFLEQALAVDYQTNDLNNQGVPTETELIALEEIDLLNDVINVTYNQRLRTFGITIDGGGSTITTGTKGFVQVPYGGSIIGWTLLATDGLVGSITVDVYKDIYANFPPNSADGITGGNKPFLSSSNKNTASSVSGWNANFSAGDIFGFNVDSVTTLTRVTLEVVVIIF